MESFTDDANPGIEVTVTYMYMMYVDHAMTVIRAMNFIMDLNIIFKIPLWILSTDIRGSKDRC
jgi:hypothetical protein